MRGFIYGPLHPKRDFRCLSSSVFLSKFMRYHEPLQWLMFNTNFFVMVEVIQVWVMPEFVHQNCVKLIGSGGAHKHSCALKPLFLLNTGSFITFLPTSISTYGKWKLKKSSKRLMKLLRKFPPSSPDKFLLPDVIN